ncbi:pilin [Patescibacteria group bacterium]
MKKKIIIILIMLSAFSLANAVDVVPGQNTNATENQTSFSDYAKGGVKYAIVLAGLLAVIMITIAGVIYVTTGGSSGKQKAKDMIWNAILGLLLVISSYLILYTINPDLVNMNIGLEQLKLPKQLKTDQDRRQQMEELHERCVSECETTGYAYDPPTDSCNCFGSGTHKECQYIAPLEPNKPGDYKCVVINTAGTDTCTNNQSCKQTLGCCKCIWRSMWITFNTSCTSGTNFQSQQSCRDHCGSLPNYSFTPSAMCDANKNCVSQ